MPKYDEDEGFGDPYADERYGSSRGEEHDESHHRASRDARNRSSRDRELTSESRERGGKGHQPYRKGKERTSAAGSSPLNFIGGYFDDPRRYEREPPAKSSDGSRRYETAESQVLFETGGNWDASGGNDQAQQDVKDDGRISMRDFEEERSRCFGQDQPTGGKAAKPSDKGKQRAR